MWCACKGEYGPTTRGPGEVDRGDVNGRMFDFVANLPDGDDWQIRIRDNSLSVGYGNAGASEALPPVALDAKETENVWKLIDALDLETRKKSKIDDEDGYFQLRLREPSGDEHHDVVTVYVSRSDDDDDVAALAKYLRTLVTKYHRKKPTF